jgi:hypothetical protein
LPFDGFWLSVCRRLGKFLDLFSCLDGFIFGGVNGYESLLAGRLVDDFIMQLNDISIIYSLTQAEQILIKLRRQKLGTTKICFFCCFTRFLVV